MQQLDIIIPSNRPEMAMKTQHGISEYESYIHDGTGYPSFAKLINDCIRFAKNEIIIIANDKVRPENHHIKKMISLLKRGFGLVGMYHFGFFGMKKELIRHIGWFDERYIGGNYEDVDFGRRLLEANIAVYISDEVEYEFKKSSWDSSQAVEWYDKKWYQTEESWGRKLPENNYAYDIGIKNPNKKWLPFKNSIMLESSAIGHRRLKLFNDKPVDFSGILSPIPNL